jgi:hypothetical protein
MLEESGYTESSLYLKAEFERVSQT